MIKDQEKLAFNIQNNFTQWIESVLLGDILTLEVQSKNLVSLCDSLRKNPEFYFEELIDICGVDYQDYGLSYWRSEETTGTGFSRSVNLSKPQRVIPWEKPRFAVVYHLLSVTHNQRLRLKVHLSGELTVASLINVWVSANWYEREAFDLYGIYFEGHPDLRRLLTDYGFKGHPFRKDFPLIGELEMRYDATEQCCVYDEVSIESRTLVPKIIRRDNRYLLKKETEE